MTKIESILWIRAVGQDLRSLEAALAAPDRAAALTALSSIDVLLRSLNVPYVAPADATANPQGFRATQVLRMLQAELEWLRSALLLLDVPRVNDHFLMTSMVDLEPALRAAQLEHAKRFSYYATALLADLVDKVKPT